MYLILVISYLQVEILTYTTAFIMRGTTVAPNFNRMDGKLAGLCPHEFPWAFDNGRKCCLSSNVANRSQPLQFDDPESSCMERNWIDCANNLCISLPYQCPGFAAVGLDGGCCFASVSRWAMNENPPCQGSKVTATTPFSCCPQDEFIYVPDCASNRKRCISSGPLPHSVRPIHPDILEEKTYPGFNAVNVFVNALCDIFETNYWVARPVDSYFIFDWGYHLVPRRVILRNSHNARYNDRGVESFELSGSGTKEPYDWIMLVEDRLANPLSPRIAPCEIPITSFAITTQQRLRYFYFDVITYYGGGAALQYISIEP